MLAFLLYLLSFCLKHAKKDIMSDNENSWKTIFEKNGYIVETELVGMGEYQFIQEMFMKKLEKIL